MFYEFPKETRIEPYLAAISGRDEFYVADRKSDDLMIINYVFVTATSFQDPFSFSDPNDAYMATLRRDCRGLKFDMNGDCVVKPYHKFKNVSESVETMADAIDWSRKHWILDKLDGSMLTPYFFNGKWVWHTKMGATDVAVPVMRYVDAVADRIPYQRFNEVAREMGVTAIYEWCSRQQRIVVDYPKDALILTGLREIATGKYYPYPLMKQLAEAAGVPVVRALEGSVENAETFIAEARGLEDVEGYVIRFDDGHMVKMKADAYCRFHKTKEGMHFEKDVWAMVLGDQVDDTKAYMDDEAREAVEAFSDTMNVGIVQLAKGIAEYVDDARERMPADKRAFAEEIKNNPDIPGWKRSLLFKVWDGFDPAETVRSHLSKNTGSLTKIDEIRPMLGGLRWDHFYKPLTTPDMD